MVDDDDGMLELLNKFVRTGLMHSGHRTTETYQLFLKPLAAMMDLAAMEPRVRSLQARNNLTIRQRASLDRYLKGLQRIRDGKDPDDLQYDDDN